MLVYSGWQQNSTDWVIKKLQFWMMEDQGQGAIWVGLQMIMSSHDLFSVYAYRERKRSLRSLYAIT